MTTTEEPKDPEYQSLRKEIEALKDDSPGDRGLALLLAEMSLGEARKMRDNPEARKPETKTEGYEIAVETRDGVVGMWSCWLKDTFFVGWPNAWEEDLASKVPASFPKIELRSRFRKDYGRHVGEWTLKLPCGEETSFETGHCSGLHHFHVLRGTTLGNYGPPQVAYGHEARDEFVLHGVNPVEYLSFESGNRFFSELYWRPTKADFRAVRDEWYSSQEEGFLSLLCSLSNGHEPKGVTVNLGFVVTPEVIASMGFETQWIRGTPGVRKGWQKDAVYGRRTLPDGGIEEVMLVSANELVPWVCYRRLPVSGPLTIEFLRSTLTF